MKGLGRHLLCELYECNPERLNSCSLVEERMHRAAVEAGATVVEQTFHKFSPHGVSGVVVIAESHLAIHTWPEYGYAAVDLFTCGEEVDPWRALDYLCAAFECGHHSTTEMRRGLIKPPEGQPLIHKPAA